MKVTIITVCLNAATNIEKTIRSIISQDYPDIEYIIVDGGSTDGTLEIISKYRDNISLLISEKDDGLYDAMNKGVLKSKGEIINFLNAGDYYLKLDIISNVTMAFKDHPEIMVLYGNSIVGEGPTQIFKQHPSSIKNLSLISTFLNHQAMFYKRLAFDSVGQFNKHYYIYADYEWNIRAFRIHKLPFFHVPMTICVYEGCGISDKTHGFKNIEISIIRKKYFSFLERMYYVLVYKTIRRIAIRNFSMPSSLRRFIRGFRG